MQALARLCVRRPVFASVLIIALIVVGGVGYTRLGVDRYPKVDFPTVAVITRLPGAAPEEVETEVTDKIEESINTIAGIDDLQSVSAEGISQVFVTFILEKNADVGAQEVRDKVNRVLAELPRDIDQPIVEKLDPDATPILSVALSGKRTLRETTEYADKVLRRQIESVNGVGQVTILGGRSRRINVRLDTERLRAYGLSAVDVRRALQTQNVKIPGGTLKAGSNEATVRVYGRVANAKEFEEIFITQRNGMPVRVGDVAKVEDSEEDAERAASKDGVPTVVLSVRKQSGTNTIAVIDALKGRLAEIAPQLPAGYSTEIVRDQSMFIKAAVDTVQEHLLVGGFLAALVVLLFLGNLRSTLIAAIAIPASIISTYGLMYAMGFTLNVLTLLALTLAVGIVIDDAIVVLENIFRFIEEKKVLPFQAAIDATKEIGLAVLATTLSLVAVFLPVAFMGGIVGRFMNSFGLTMAFAILVSLLVSFSLTPMLSARFLKRDEKKAAAGHGGSSKSRGFYAVIDRTYTAMLNWAIGHRWVVVLICVLVLATVPILFKVVPKNFLPYDDESQFEVNFRAPEGTSLEATALIGNRISKDVRTLPGVEYALLTVGADDAKTPNVASIYVKLVDAEQAEGVPDDGHGARPQGDSPALRGREAADGRLVRERILERPEERRDHVRPQRPGPRQAREGLGHAHDEAPDGARHRRRRLDAHLRQARARRHGGPLEGVGPRRLRRGRRRDAPHPRRRRKGLGLRRRRRAVRRLSPRAARGPHGRGEPQAVQRPVLPARRRPARGRHVVPPRRRPLGDPPPEPPPTGHDHGEHEPGLLVPDRSRPPRQGDEGAEPRRVLHVPVRRAVEGAGPFGAELPARVRALGDLHVPHPRGAVRELAPPRHDPPRPAADGAVRAPFDPHLRAEREHLHVARNPRPLRRRQEERDPPGRVREPAPRARNGARRRRHRSPAASASGRSS